MIIYMDNHSTIQKYTFNVGSPFTYKNWIMNRPPDLRRVDEITDDLIERRVTVMDGIICVFKLNNDPSWHVYDGIHRLYAIEKYIAHTNEQISCIIKFDTPLCIDEIYANFNRINKNIPLPSIYLENPSKENESIKIICMNISTIFSQKFPTMCKPSNNPQRPHFNRDHLMNNLTHLQINFTKENIEQLLYTTIIELNDCMKGILLHDIYNQKQKRDDATNQTIYDRENIILKKKEKLFSKCEKTNCFIFGVDWHVLKEKIEQVFQLLER